MEAILKDNVLYLDGYKIGDISRREHSAVVDGPVSKMAKEAARAMTKAWHEADDPPHDADDIKEWAQRVPLPDHVREWILRDFDGEVLEFIPVEGKGDLHLVACRAERDTEPSEAARWLARNWDKLISSSTWKTSFPEEEVIEWDRHPTMGEALEWAPSMMEVKDTFRAMAPFCEEDLDYIAEAVRERIAARLTWYDPGRARAQRWRMEQEQHRRERQIRQDWRW